MEQSQSQPSLGVYRDSQDRLNSLRRRRVQLFIRPRDVYAISNKSIPPDFLFARFAPSSTVNWGTAMVKIKSCHCCGLIHHIPDLADGQLAICVRCQTVIEKPYRATGSSSRTAALALAAFILYWPAVLLPSRSKHFSWNA